MYYDVECSHDVFPPGTTDCSGPVPGGNVIYDSPDDKLANLPDLINPANGSFPGFDADGPSLLKRIKDGPIVDAINAAWTRQTGDANDLIVAGTDDDLWQSYLSVKTQAAADFVKSYLWNHSATAVLYDNDGVNRGTEQVAHSGLAQIYPGHEAAASFGVPYSDPSGPERAAGRPAGGHEGPPRHR